MGKMEGIARGDKKEINCLHLFVEGWSTCGRRNNLREKKVDLRMLSPVTRSWLICVH